MPLTELWKRFALSAMKTSERVDASVTQSRPVLPGLRPATSRLVALCVAMATVAFLLFSYNLVNKFSTWRGVTMFDPEELFVFDGQSFDSLIPYLPWTFYIYISLFLVYLLPVVTYPKTDRGADALVKLYGGLVVITLVACVVFVLSPAEMPLRKAVVNHDGNSEAHAGVLALQEYARFNTWPSLHVAQSGLIFFMVARWLARRRWHLLLCFAWVVLSISTLTIKEHFVWDMITGGLLAIGYWHWRLRRFTAVVSQATLVSTR